MLFKDKNGCISSRGLPFRTTLVLMKVSVITVSLNRASCICNAIASVQSQNFKEVEHVLVDGGSTDGTIDLISSMMRPGDIFLCEPDLGLYDAINKGLRRATGDIISILHSDDLFESSEVLSRIVDLFQKRDLDIVYGDAVFVSKRFGGRVVRRYHSGILSLRRLSWGWMPAHTAMFIRRDLYQEVGGYKLGYRIAADYEFLCRLLSSRQIYWDYVPEVLVRMTTGGVSTGGVRNTVILNHEVLRACAENGVPTNFVKLMSKYPLKLLGLVVKGSTRR